MAKRFTPTDAEMNETIQRFGGKRKVTAAAPDATTAVPAPALAPTAAPTARVTATAAPVRSKVGEVFRKAKIAAGTAAVAALGLGAMDVEPYAGGIEAVTGSKKARQALANEREARAAATGVRTPPEEAFESSTAALNSATQAYDEAKVAMQAFSTTRSDKNLNAFNTAVIAAKAAITDTQAKAKLAEEKVSEVVAGDAGTEPLPTNVIASDQARVKAARAIGILEKLNKLETAVQVLGGATPEGNSKQTAADQALADQVEAMKLADLKAATLADEARRKDALDADKLKSDAAETRVWNAEKEANEMIQGYKDRIDLATTEDQVDTIFAKFAVDKGVSADEAVIKSEGADYVEDQDPDAIFSSNDVYDEMNQYAADRIDAIKKLDGERKEAAKNLTRWVKEWSEKFKVQLTEAGVDKKLKEFTDAHGNAKKLAQANKLRDGERYDKESDISALSGADSVKTEVEKAADAAKKKIVDALTAESKRLETLIQTLESQKLEALNPKIAILKELLGQMMHVKCPETAVSIVDYVNGTLKVRPKIDAAIKVGFIAPEGENIDTSLRKFDYQRKN